MSSFHVRVLDGGKISLPAALRRKHGFEVGKILVVDDGPSGISIRTLDNAVAAAQTIMAGVAPPQRVLSNELISSRREQARRE
jgi:bifunctional DNA-binding transcriptional regulator/antitoxin component of YhaV-PrlF toxin-antitoxin module